jgi:hypothetical protein
MKHCLVNIQEDEKGIAGKSFNDRIFYQRSENYVIGMEKHRLCLICFVIALVFINIEAKGQIMTSQFWPQNEEEKQKAINDTLPVVRILPVTESNSGKGLPILLFINGEFFDADDPISVAFHLQNKGAIITTESEEGNIEFSGKKYAVSLHIKTKDNYTPQLISLRELVLKYVGKIENPVMFIVDKHPVFPTDYDTYKIDEKNIMLVSVVGESGLMNGKDNAICVVELLTRSQENIANITKEFYIKGISSEYEETVMK